ncbi:MAG TPA: hypothetical protein ENN69_04455, partial [Spirochaetia bacterium]|nr:hypothetical protein [Spirochaetia bacterium]
MLTLISILTFTVGALVSAVAEDAGGTSAPTPLGVPSSTQQEFIDRYIDGLLYMVYIDEDREVRATDKDLYRAAIAAANDFLASRSMEVVLLDQVEELKRDHTTLVE